MKFLILLLLCTIFLPNFSIAELDSSEYYSREQTNSKISNILLKWQSSENPDEFAKINGLLYKDGTVQIYIHLTDEEFLWEIPPEINVVASDQKIAVTYVTPQQLDIFENLDFVERVSLPDLAITPPIPQIAIPEKIQEEKIDFTLMIIISILVVIITIFVINLQRKRTKTA